MTCSRLVLGRISNRHYRPARGYVTRRDVEFGNSTKVDTKELPRSRHHIEVPAAWFLLLRV